MRKPWNLSRQVIKLNILHGGSMNEIEIVNEYVERTGWYVDWCDSCKIWAVHCPECGANRCGGGCDCGYSIAMERQQRKLDELLSS